METTPGSSAAGRSVRRALVVVALAALAAPGAAAGVGFATPTEFSPWR